MKSWAPAVAAPSVKEIVVEMLTQPHPHQVVISGAVAERHLAVFRPAPIREMTKPNVSSLNSQFVKPAATARLRAPSSATPDWIEQRAANC
jgi:hypothetical protein